MSDIKSTEKNVYRAAKFNAEEYLAFMAPLSGIPIDDAWKPVICSHLTTAANMAAIVNAAPIDINTIELANTYSLD